MPVATSMRAPVTRQSTLFADAVIAYFANAVGNEEDEFMELDVYQAEDKSCVKDCLRRTTFNYMVRRFWAQIQAEDTSCVNDVVFEVHISLPCTAPRCPTFCLT